MSQRNFPKRHIYFILDGQKLDEVSQLTFMLHEVNERLCGLIPNKVWNCKEAQTQDLYKRVEMANPSNLILE